MKRLALVLAALLCLPVAAGITGFVRVDETYFAKESGTKRVVIMPGASLWVLRPGATVSATDTSSNIPVYDSDTLAVGNVIEVSSTGMQSVITSIPNLTTVVVSPAISFATGDRLLQVELEILLYLDPTGGITIPQPIIAGPNGEVGFYMSDGEPVYDIKVVGTDGTRVVRYDIPNAGGGTGGPGGGEPPAGVPTDVQLKEGTGFGIAPGFKANPTTGDVQMRGPTANVKAFGALCDGTTDDGAAINAAIAAAAGWGTAGATGGGDIFIPQGICMTSVPIVLANVGMRLRGENARASVIKATSGFSPGAEGGVVVFKKGTTGGSDKATAASISHLSIDANDVDAHALVMYEAYDQITIDNIYVTGCEDAYNCLRIAPNPAEVGGNVISQTIEINNSSFIKLGSATPATAGGAVVYLERTQEVVITGSKAFQGVGSYTPGSGALLGANWHINGGRGIVMNGISAAFSNGPCILLEGEAATNSVQGVGIYTPTIEGCDTILETRASGGGCSGGTTPPGTACTLPAGAECLGGGTCIARTIQRVAMHNPRYQYNTFNGVIKLDDLQISEIHANGAVTSLSPTCDQNRIMSQRPSAVRNIAGVDCGTVTAADGSCGTNNEIRSWSNAIEPWGSVNTPFAVRRATTPEFQWRVPFHDPAYWKMIWSASDPNDFGWQLGYVDPAGVFQRYMQVDSATGNVQTKILNGVRQAAEYAEFGNGTSSFPYLGWEDSICDQCQTHFAAGHYATTTGVDLQLTLNNRPGRTSITGDGFESTTITATADVTALRVRATVGVCNVGGAFCTAGGSECGANTCVMTGQIHLEGLGFSAGVNNTQANGLVSIEGMDTQWSMRNISIRDRSLDGNTSQAVNLGLRILNSQNAVIENLYVRSTQSAVPTMLTGVFITSNDAAQRGNLTFVGGQVSRVGTAFKIDTAHCLAGANKGLWCDDAGDCPGSSCVNENNLSGISFYGMKLVNGAGTVALPGPQQNTKGFDVEAAGDSLLFSNVHIENFQTGIELDGANGVTIQGGIISGANNNNQTPSAGNAILIGHTTNCVGVLINGPTLANCRAGISIGAQANQRITYVKGYVINTLGGMDGSPGEEEWLDNTTVPITTASSHGNMRIEGGTFPDGLVVKRQDSNTNGLWLWNNDVSTESEHSPNISFTPSGALSDKDTKIRTNSSGNLEFKNNDDLNTLSLSQTGVVRLFTPMYATCTALETNASGDVLCGADDGGGGGDAIIVGATPVTSPDSATFNNTTPAAVSGANVLWQYSSPNVSAYTPLNTASVAGVVSAPGVVDSMVWKTNASGVPAWRPDEVGLPGSGDEVTVDTATIASPANFQDSTDVLFTPSGSNIQATVVDSSHFHDKHLTARSYWTWLDRAAYDSNADAVNDVSTFPGYTGTAAPGRTTLLTGFDDPSGIVWSEKYQVWIVTVNNLHDMDGVGGNNDQLGIYQKDGTRIWAGPSAAGGDLEAITLTNPNGDHFYIINEGGSNTITEYSIPALLATADNTAATAVKTWDIAAVDTPNCFSADGYEGLTFIPDPTQCTDYTATGMPCGYFLAMCQQTSGFYKFRLDNAAAVQVGTGNTNISTCGITDGSGIGNGIDYDFRTGLIWVVIGGSVDRIGVFDPAFNCVASFVSPNAGTTDYEGIAIGPEGTLALCSDTPGGCYAVQMPTSRYRSQAPLPYVRKTCNQTAEGETCWDADGDVMRVGTGSGTVTLGGGGSGDQVVVNGGGDITSPVSFQTSGDIAFSNPSGSNIQATIVADSIGSGDVGILDADADTNLAVNAPLVFSGSVISMPAASDVAAGHVTTTAQSFGGAKTFVSDVVAASFDAPPDDDTGGSITIKEPTDAGMNCGAGWPDGDRECLWQLKVANTGLFPGTGNTATGDWLFEIGTDGKIPSSALDVAHGGQLVGTAFAWDWGAGIMGCSDMSSGSGCAVDVNSTEAGFFSSSTTTCTGTTGSAGKAQVTSLGMFLCDATGSLRTMVNEVNPLVEGKVSFDVLGGSAVSGDTSCLNDVGKFWFDVTSPTAGVFKFCQANDATAPSVLGGVGGGTFLSLTDTPDAYVNGKIVRSTASAMEFADAINVDHTTVPTPAVGDILYWSGAEYDRLPIGGTGEVLGSTGSALDWVASGGTSLVDLNGDLDDDGLPDRLDHAATPSPAPDAAGEIGIDDTATQIIAFGNAARVFDPRQWFSYVIPVPADTDDYLIFKAPYALTITDVDCIVGSSGPHTITLRKCSTAGDCTGATTIEAVSCTTGGAADDGIGVPEVAAGEWLQVLSTAPTGTPSFTSITVGYLVVQE